MNEVACNAAPAPAMRGPNDYKSDVKPVWCPGCGDFGVVNALAKAMAKMALERRTSPWSPASGCSSRIPGLHGELRLPRRARPRARRRHRAQGRAADLTVIVTGGDGDGYSIAATTSCTPAAAT